MADAGGAHVRLHIVAVGGREGLAIDVVGVHHALVGGLAGGAVPAVQHAQVHRAAQQGVLARLILHGGQGAVHVAEHGKNIVRRMHQLAHLGQQLFLLSGEGMGLVAQQIVDEHVVFAEIGIAFEGGQHFLRQGQQLGAQEGALAACAGGKSLDARQQALGLGIAAVLVQAHASVDEQPLNLAADGKIGADGRAEIGCHPAAAGGKGGNCRLGGGKKRVKGGRARQHIVQVPHPAGVHFIAFLRLLHGSASSVSLSTQECSTCARACQARTCAKMR